MENQNANVQANVPQFFNAVGKREAKAVNEAVVVAESTRSSFRITPAIAGKLGVSDAQYVTMQLVKNESGVVTDVYIGRGKDATYKKNEDGSIVLDERKRKVADVEGYGALTAETTPGSNVLKFSVASAWDVLGDTEKRKYYKLADEGITTQLPIGNGEFLTTTLYRLEFVREEAKSVRTKSDKEDSPVATQEVAPSTEQAVQPTQEQAPAPNQFSEDDEF